MVISERKAHFIVAAIIALHVMLGTLYALETPKWQVPDEPAHFNYIQYVALQNELPVLQVGDFPGDYLNEIKSAKFPPDMSIAPIRYESWQPPLYYSLGALVYRLTSSLGKDVQFVALRLFSVMLGAAVLWAIYRTVQEVYPHSEFLALGATAFAATIPMHLALSAGISNDTLSELILSLILWQSVGIVQRGLDLQRGMVVGTLLGLALLTKTTIYIAFGVVAVAVLIQTRSRRATLRQALVEGVPPLLGVFALAMLFGAPWFVRNAQVYGNLDVLAWQRHDLVVAGQLRTSDLLAEIGWLELVRRFVATTFRSFWAQFGWMGVLVDQRIYLALALFTGLLGLGFALFLRRMAHRQSALSHESDHARLNSEQKRALGVLALSALLTILIYIGYNLKFVQHQGRYLFPALAPISLAAALSLKELFEPRTARTVAGVLLVVILLVLANGALRNDISGWSVILLLGGTTLLGAAGWLPVHWRWLAPVLTFAVLMALDLISLYGYVVPALR
jgi:hypothetical protein